MKFYISDTFWLLFHLEGLIISTRIGALAIVAMIFLFYSTEWKHLLERILCFASLRKIDDQNVEAFLKSFGSLVPKRYSYLEIKKSPSLSKINLVKEALVVFIKESYMMGTMWQ